MGEDRIPSGPEFGRFRREYDSLSSEPPQEAKPSRPKSFFQRLSQIETEYRPESTFDDISVLMARDEKALKAMVGETLYQNYVLELRSVKKFEQANAFLNMITPRLSQEVADIEHDPFATRGRYIPRTNERVPLSQTGQLSERQHALIQKRLDLMNEDTQLRVGLLDIQNAQIAAVDAKYKGQISELKKDLDAVASQRERAKGKIEGKKAEAVKIYRQEQGIPKKDQLPQELEASLKAGVQIPEELVQALDDAQQAYDKAYAIHKEMSDAYESEKKALVERCTEIGTELQAIKKRLAEVFESMYREGLINKTEHEYLELSRGRMAACEEELEKRKYLQDLEKRAKQLEKAPSEQRSDDELGRLQRLLADAREAHARCEKEIARFDRKQYERGMIPFSELRLRMIGDNMASIFAKETFLSSLNAAWQEDGRIRDDVFASYKQLYEQAIASRMRDLMLAAPGESAGEIKKYVAEVMKKAGAVLGDILSDKTIDTINEKGKEQLIHEVLNSIMYPHYRLEIIVGFGGSEDDLNIRLPSYIIPALHAVHSFIKAGVKPPKLRIVNAQALAVKINGKDENITRRNSYDTNTLLTAFVERFYPDCRPAIECFIPTLEESLGGTYYGDVAHLGKFIPPTDDQLDSPDERKKLSEFDIAFGELSRRGRKHGEESDDSKEQEAENFVAYAAAHAYLFGNIQHVARKDPPNGVIKFGGSGEHYFNVIQQYLADHHRVESIASRFYLTNTAARGKVNDEESGGKKWRGSRPIFVTQTVGGNPPYYRAGKTGKHEITIDEIVRGDKQEMAIDQAIDYYNQDEMPQVRDARHDLELLQKELGDEYFKFLRAYKGIEER